MLITSINRLSLILPLCLISLSHWDKFVFSCLQLIFAVSLNCRVGFHAFIFDDCRSCNSVVEISYRRIHGWNLHKFLNLYFIFHSAQLLPNRHEAIFWAGFTLIKKICIVYLNFPDSKVVGFLFAYIWELSRTKYMLNLQITRHPQKWIMDGCREYLERIDVF